VRPKRQGLSRRGFFKTGSGMAAAPVALNQVFGECYDVTADEVDGPEAFQGRWPKDDFIFDVAGSGYPVPTKRSCAEELGYLLALNACERPSNVRSRV
jgi:hypothetical protein